MRYSERDFKTTDAMGVLNSYHVFNGTPEIILVCKDRTNGLKEDFYTVAWQHIDVKRTGHDNFAQIINKPETLDEMLQCFEILGKNISFLRTDWYEINGKLYFGELTFFPASGFNTFNPEVYDVEFGKMLKIER